MTGVLSSSTRTCERPRRTFLPPEMLLADCCSFLRPFRTAL